jgi:hypothetical protein
MCGYGYLAPEVFTSVVYEDEWSAYEPNQTNLIYLISSQTTTYDFTYD